jgi:hypothetical protein
LTIEALVDVAIEISGACAATGWLYSLISMHNWWACLFPKRAQVEVFADPCVLVASGVMVGDIERTPDGYIDINAAAARGGLAWDTAGLFYGRLASGLPPSAFDRSGRQIAYLPGAT